MGKVTVLRCDVCEEWDSKTLRVRTVTVAGPKFDLCAACRTKVLVFVGVNAPRALAYQMMIDEKDHRNGAFPPLSRVDSAVPETGPELPLEATADSEVQGDGEDQEEAAEGDMVAPAQPFAVELESGEVAEQNVVKPVPKKARR